MEQISVSSAMMLRLREEHENGFRPPTLLIPKAHCGTIEQAAARRDRRDLVQPSPCFKLIRARPVELSVTTGHPVSTSRKLVFLPRLSPPTHQHPLLV